MIFGLMVIPLQVLSADVDWIANGTSLVPPLGQFYRSDNPLSILGRRVTASLVRA